ncbi:MAG: hypothetical protein JNK56_16430 [Myxococcales bacterium]|nr:hypothetical protein [Myxococcales bacterium]
MNETSWRSISLILIGIILGCGANAIHGANAQPTYAPNPAAPRWQQFCEHLDFDKDAAQRIQSAGDSGWELVGMNLIAQSDEDAFVCFKRPAA